MATSGALIRDRASTIIEGLTPDTTADGATQFRRWRGVLSMDGATESSAGDRMFEARMERGQPSDLLIEPSHREWDGILTVVIGYEPSLGDLDSCRDRMREDVDLISSTLALADTSGLHGYTSGNMSIQGAWPLDDTYEDDLDPSTGGGLFLATLTMRVLHRQKRT